MTIMIDGAPLIRSDDLADHGQCFDLATFGQIGDCKVRYRLHIDRNYWRQSYGLVEVFSPVQLQWNEVWTLHAAQLEHAPRDHDHATLFASDLVQMLYELAAQVLTD